MFGLIGHSTSFEDAKRKASMLGFDHIADGDLDVWCTCLLYTSDAADE